MNILAHSCASSKFCEFKESLTILQQRIFSSRKKWFWSLLCISVDTPEDGCFEICPWSLALMISWVDCWINVLRAVLELAKVQRSTNQTGEGGTQKDFIKPKHKFFSLIRIWALESLLICEQRMAPLQWYPNIISCTTFSSIISLLHFFFSLSFFISTAKDVVISHLQWPL